MSNVRGDERKRVYALQGYLLETCHVNRVEGGKLIVDVVALGILEH